MSARKQLMPERKRDAFKLLESGSRLASELAHKFGGRYHQLYA